MKILTTGHKYELDSFEDGQPQVLQFIEKDAAMNTIHDGTTNEEVLSMLINRLNYLNERLPSRETAVAITNLDQALLWLQKRTADRIQRGVEGSSKA
jgi:hypothetical protein